MGHQGVLLNRGADSGGPGRTGVSSPAQPYGFVILLLSKQGWDVPTQSPNAP